MSLIQLQNISKIYQSSAATDGILESFWRLIRPQYQTHLALQNIQFEIQAGECVGLVGPNGAGKSTLTKILSGIQKPSTGLVKVLDFIPSEKKTEFFRSIGVVFGHKNSLWWDLPLRESFETARVLYRIDSNTFSQNLTDLLEVFALNKILDQTPRTFSLGERVKAELAMNLLHSPRVLLLDEPTVGLDLSSKHEIRDYLNRIRKQKKMAILLTSHDIQDIDQCCDRVLLLNQGKLVFDGSAEELQSQIGTVDTQSLEDVLLNQFREWRKKSA